ncbi:ankyrin repeat domain-containing protein [Chryseobacterium sp. 3008163]|uniref:ankyrin repeat domain-containing protein n=1 Tax=Chryseobacterium sp. 3008163 TaxID=2478663 RepID=UPI000F0CCAF7|nr:ankyrin repeat domain-containing protein [Chryseobacterium sp. 3008163]AYN01247.1 ankyrin repeat domain-containing protein [Chryseobacterium sp. 3008163]
MKKIISATLLLAISIFANGLFAQQVSKDQMKIFQTDNLQGFKTAFTQEEYNKCFNIKDRSYDLLSLAVRHERKNNFAFLINNTTDVNRVCGNNTPLIVAATYGRIDMAKALLKKGASKSVKNSNGETAKDIAIKNNHPELAKIL